jgi:hypothetical protein
MNMDAKSDAPAMTPTRPLLTPMCLQNCNTGNSLKSEKLAIPVC